MDLDKARELGRRPLTEKIEMLTDDQAPTFDSFEELAAFLEEISNQNLDYGTAGSAMAYAGVCAFNTMARKVGATGFQASIASLMAYGSIQRIEGPYGVVKAEEMLFPQNQTPTESAQEMENEWLEWASEEAQKKIDEHNQSGWTEEVQKYDPETEEPIEGETETRERVHPNVKAHWEKLASLQIDKKEE
jgi:hypothetical protein